MGEWFEMEEVAPGVQAIAEPHHAEEVISYLVEGERQAILFDTGMGVANIREAVEALTEKPITVVNSHAHYDHIGDNHRFRLIAIHPAEAHLLGKEVDRELLRRAMRAENIWGPLPEGFDPHTYRILPSRANIFLEEGQKLDLGGRTLMVLHTPGHSPGSICLLDEGNGLLFSGDTAYAGPLYIQLPGADFAAYRRSMERLAGLAPQLEVVLPAHNVTPLDPSILEEMAAGLEEIARGTARYDLRDSPWGPIGEYRFDRFSVYLSAKEVP
jgi:glyoxylase-like metal-dependent hydrolase (beta-lactamase superfamily II)